jgi:two-component system, OmpR family, sensor histidine kinase BaeS
MAISQTETFAAPRSKYGLPGYLRLQHKVLIALLTLMMVLLMVFIGVSRWGLQRSLGDYVAEIELSRMDWLIDKLEQDYAEHGGWQFLGENPEAWDLLQLVGRPRLRGQRRPGDIPPMPPFAFQAAPNLRGASAGSSAFPMPPPLGLPPDGFFPPPLDGLDAPRPPPDSVYERMALLNADANARLAGSHVAIAGTVKRALQHNNKVIAYLAIAPMKSMSSEAGRAFISEQLSFIVVTGCIGGVLALTFSWVLAKRWLTPIHALMAGAQALTQGKLDAQVPVHGHDELAQLTLTFNAMARRLAETQESHQRWLSDVAHELRTPLTVMRGEIEAMLDGVRLPTAQTGQRLHRQVLRLTQLVDDLRMSMADQAAFEDRLVPGVRPLEVLMDALTMMQGRFQDVGIQVDVAYVVSAMSKHPEWTMAAVADRLHQVFINLLGNSLQYTNPGGQLKITVQEQPIGHLHICLEDSAPAPSAHDMPHLFERLYRADTSRNRPQGGSGLGLAICKTIVEGHGGSISAALSPLGGLRIDLVLPLQTTVTEDTHATA